MNNRERGGSGAFRSVRGGSNEGSRYRGSDSYQNDNYSRDGYQNRQGYRGSGSNLHHSMKSNQSGSHFNGDPHFSKPRQYEHSRNGNERSSQNLDYEGPRRAENNRSNFGENFTYHGNDKKSNQNLDEHRRTHEGRSNSRENYVYHGNNSSEKNIKPRDLQSGQAARRDPPSFHSSTGHTAKKAKYTGVLTSLPLTALKSPEETSVTNDHEKNISAGDASREIVAPINSIPETTDSLASADDKVSPRKKKKLPSEEFKRWYNDPPLPPLERPMIPATPFKGLKFNETDYYRQSDLSTQRHIEDCRRFFDLEMKTVRFRIITAHCMAKSNFIPDEHKFSK